MNKNADHHKGKPKVEDVVAYNTKGIFPMKRQKRTNERIPSLGYSAHGRTGRSHEEFSNEQVDRWLKLLKGFWVVKDERGNLRECKESTDGAKFLKIDSKDYSVSYGVSSTPSDLSKACAEDEEIARSNGS